jgi:hypothetical protein
MSISQRKGSWLGVASVALSVCFWFYVRSGWGPNQFTRSPYVWFVLLPAILAASAVAALAAAMRGSKWWLFALVGPVSGALLMGVASV